MSLYSRKRKGVGGEQFYILVPVIWAEQGTEETYPGAAHGSAACSRRYPTAAQQGAKELLWELAGATTEPSQLPPIDSKLSKALKLAELTPWDGSVSPAQKQGAALLDRPSSTEVPSGPGRSVNLVSTTDDPSTVQANTLKER